jgi:DNA-binding FrmR family transcriptional regulator
MGLCGDDHEALIARLNRIEGQVRGIRKMVQDDRPCMEVLKQTAAVTGALRSVGMFILEDHLKGCVAQAITSHENTDEMIQQVIGIFNKFTK